MPGIMHIDGIEFERRDRDFGQYMLHGPDGIVIYHAQGILRHVDFPFMIKQHGQYLQRKDHLPRSFQTAAAAFRAFKKTSGYCAQGD